MKKKYSYEFKQEVVNYYLAGKGGYRKTAQHFNIVPSQVKGWVGQYQFQGKEALLPKTSYQQYDTSFKYQVIQAMLSNGLSQQQIITQFHLPPRTKVSLWLKRYQEKGIMGLTKQIRRAHHPMNDKKVPKPDIQKTQAELLKELEYLRAENAYLKKLDALIQQKQAQKKKQ